MPPKKVPVRKEKTPKGRKSPRKAPTKVEKPLPKEIPPEKSQSQSGTGIRIRLSAFDHHVLDEAAAKILDTAERSGAVVHGPLPLPTHIRKFTVNKSTFVHKNARDQYEMRIHRRLIDLTETTFKTVESLQSLSLPSGVDIEIQMK
ncbi:30S ribosomal protein S10 [Candidatus Peregrinibacteria bacterium]|nr:30S ribosomal protein S10 [Candidatus Peregrinibacteria bacterium]